MSVLSVAVTQTFATFFAVLVGLSTLPLIYATVNAFKSPSSLGSHPTLSRLALLGLLLLVATVIVFLIRVASASGVDQPLQRDSRTRKLNGRSAPARKKNITRTAGLCPNKLLLGKPKGDACLDAISNVQGFKNRAFEFRASLVSVGLVSKLVPEAYAALHYNNEIVSAPRSTCNVRCEVESVSQDQKSVTGSVHLLWNLHHLAKENRVPDFVSIQLQLGDSLQVGHVALLSNTYKVLVIKSSVRESYRRWIDKAEIGIQAATTEE